MPPPEVPAKQKQVQEKIATARYVMPVPRGCIVAWRAGDQVGDSQPAIVTKITRDTIDVLVFSASSSYRAYEGCRHRTDPSLIGRTEPNPGGIFELTPLETMVVTRPSRSLDD